MEPSKKGMYCSPEAKVFEVKIEGIICVSDVNGGDTGIGYGGGGNGPAR